MRKIAKKTALLLSLTALVATTAALGVVQKANLQTANAQTLTAQTASGQTALIAPDSYQEYLSLNNPMDLAISDGYTAIADGNFIYVYDAQKDNYRKYVHTLNQADPSKNNVMQLQFYNDELYFLDGTYLYSLHPETLQVSNVSLTENDPKFPCSSFLIVDDVLYYTDVKTQASISYITLDGTKADTLDAVTGKPSICFWNRELYYTDAGKHLYKVNPSTKEDALVAADFADDLVSMQIHENVFICTTLSGDFYAYNLSEFASAHSAREVVPLAHYKGGYSTLALFGDYVYAVKGSSVRQYSLENSEFTDFEICNASSSIHRLDSASETLLFDNRLYIADNGNNRISVYDVINDRFDTPIITDFAPKYLACDENTLLAADDVQAVLYDLTEDGEEITSFGNFHGNLVGIANVYGKYYFATDSNYYYAATETTTETDGVTETAWTVSESQKTSTHYAKLLTSDVYGYLYVASGNSVYRFSEESFLDGANVGELLPISLPTATAKILVDYNGDVYALANGVLQKTTEPNPYALNEPPVYSESATVQSFAFGVEENVTYVLYKENYLIKTDILDLPTVKNLPVEGVDKEILGDNIANVEIVKLRGFAMLIDFDLSSLADAEVFPYLDYSRRETPLTALKIGETQSGKHAILAFYDTEKKAYRAVLALNSDCLALTDEEKQEYFKTCPTPSTMYTSNEVPVYKFPHLSNLPTVATLPRGEQISVLGEINDLDHSYYLVQYVDSENVTRTGYVPQRYAIAFSATPSTPDENVYGYVKTDKDGIRTLVILLLGGAAILILTDVLIFRFIKKKKDD